MRRPSGESRRRREARRSAGARLSNSEWRSNSAHNAPGLSIRPYPAGGYSSDGEDQEQGSPVRHTRFLTWCRTPLPPLPPPAGGRYYLNIPNSGRDGGGRLRRYDNVSHRYTEQKERKRQAFIVETPTDYVVRKQSTRSPADDQSEAPRTKQNEKLTTSLVPRRYFNLTCRNSNEIQGATRHLGIVSFHCFSSLTGERETNEPHKGNSR